MTKLGLIKIEKKDYEYLPPEPSFNKMALNGNRDGVLIKPKAPNQRLD